MTPEPGAALFAVRGEMIVTSRKKPVPPVQTAHVRLDHSGWSAAIEAGFHDGKHIPLGVLGGSSQLVRLPARPKAARAQGRSWPRPAKTRGIAAERTAHDFRQRRSAGTKTGLEFSVCRSPGVGAKSENGGFGSQ